MVITLLSSVSSDTYFFSPKKRRIRKRRKDRKSVRIQKKEAEKERENEIWQRLKTPFASTHPTGRLAAHGHCRREGCKDVLYCPINPRAKTFYFCSNSFFFSSSFYSRVLPLPARVVIQTLTLGDSAVMTRVWQN